jgi:dienelactone hydrolase
MVGSIRGVAVVLLAAVLPLTSCGSGNSAADHAVLTVQGQDVLADQPFHATLTGLRAHDKAVITAHAVDYAGKGWTSTAIFTADAVGRIDLATQAPGPGSTYTGTDAMGLAWSMGPDGGDAGTSAFWTVPPDRAAAFTITVTASVHGHLVAQANLTRRWLAAGVTFKRLRPADSKIWGELFTPPPGTPRHPAVLVFDGSEGGESQDLAAALLASHGYPALSLAYFHEPGLPTDLADVPLEYFATAAHILGAAPGTDPMHILAMGYSRGTEAALLLAQDMPTVFHGAVLYAPGDTVGDAFPAGDAAWTLGGNPIKAGGQIPVDHIDGPVLTVAGGADGLWDSSSYAHVINNELSQAARPYQHQVLEYPDAGHLVGTFPYMPAGTNLMHPIMGDVMRMGGTRAADNAAQADSWPKVLALLASLHS